MRKLILAALLLCAFSGCAVTTVTMTINQYGDVAVHTGSK